MGGSDGGAGAGAGALKVVGFILLSPVILVGLLLFLAAWFICTVTCLGPLLNYLFNSRDEEEFGRLPEDVKLIQTPQKYRLAVRYSGWANPNSSTSASAPREGADEKVPLLKSSSSKFSFTRERRNFPIIIPNGLAATVATTGRIHENLVQAGFQVISFDRYGVGMSDENTTDRSPTVDECVCDVLFVMNAVLPNQDKFIILGPSMGAIVGQCVIAKHPEKVAGFLNMDGFPAAFENKREKFLGASGLWNMMGWVTHTGLIRFMLQFLDATPFSTPAFPPGLVRYQMNKQRFFSNTKLEFPLMMDLASEATRAWGSLAINRLEPHLVEALVRAKPDQNGAFENGEWRTLPRALSEHGDDWATPEQTALLVQMLKAMTDSELARVWSRLPVRVMNGRDYSYAGGDSFYDQEMKDKAAAEGELQALLAGDGARYAFPARGHDKMFHEVDAITHCSIEIDNAALRLQASDV